jgi:hypothetical protein
MNEHAIPMLEEGTLWMATPDSFNGEFPVSMHDRG